MEPLQYPLTSQLVVRSARCDPTSENPKEVLIDPRNIITNPVKKGPSIDKVLLLRPSYNAVGEPYKPPNF